MKERVSVCKFTYLSFLKKKILVSKQKIISGFLSIILISSVLLCPIVYAIDSSKGLSQSENVVQQEKSQEKEVAIFLKNKKTDENINNVGIEIRERDSNNIVEKWATSDEIKNINLKINKEYLIKVNSVKGYDAFDDEIFKIDENGDVFVLSDGNQWDKEEKSGTLILSMIPSIDSGNDKTTNDDSSDKENTHKAEEKKILTVTLPKINVYDAEDNTKDWYPASFMFYKESEPEMTLASWVSAEDSPTLDLEVGVVYDLKESDVYQFQDNDKPIKIRITANGKFEQYIDDSWKEVDVINIAIKKLKRSKLLRASRGITQPETITEGDIAPFNNMQIIKNMPSTSRVEIIDVGSQVDSYVRVSGGNQTQTNNRVHGGDYRIEDTGYGLDPNIRKAMDNSSRTAMLVRFKPSNWSDRGYQTDPNSGWSESDLSLDTTGMWVKVRYTDAAYYDGQLVDAIATIKVTPYKNRTININNGSEYYSAYSQYYPLIEISDLLFGGWVWQNVNKFQVDLQFVPRGGDESQAILMPEGDLNSKNAAYYTINSLDPQREPSWDYPNPAAYGPESVVPAEGTVSGAYVVPNSNIVTSYAGGPNGNQTAYNGGTTPWGTVAGRESIDDVPGSDTWSLNSVLFTTSATTHVTVTLGNLERSPVSQRVPRTNYVWATISTEAFTNNFVKYIDIPIQKVWQDEENSHESVTIDLYAVWTADGKKAETLIQSQTLSDENNWNTVFKQVPDQESLEKIIRQNFTQDAREIHYDVREREISSDYQPSYSGDSTAETGFTVTNKKVKTGLTITKKWQENGAAIDNESTKDFGKIKVTLKRKVGNLVDATFQQDVELLYDTDGTKSWKKSIDGLPIADENGVKYTYFIEEDMSTIPDFFYIKDYLNNGIELSQTKDNNHLGVTNNRESSQLIIQKKWYNKDGKEISNEKLPESLSVKLYRTTDGSTNNGELYKEVRLKRQNNDGKYTWRITESVPVRDSGGSYYTYYIEEDVPKEYLEISDDNDKFIKYSDDNATSDVTLTLKNKVNPTYPVTGGIGILPFISIGLVILLMAVMLYYMQNRKEI